MDTLGSEDGRKTARLFRNGRSQAVRIPREFEFKGDEVLIGRDAEGRLTLEPVRRKLSLLAVLAALEPLPPEDLPSPIEDYPPEPIDLGSNDEA